MQAFTSTESINYLYQTPVQNLHILSNGIVVAQNSAKKWIGVDIFGGNSPQWRLNSDVTKDHELLFTNDKILGWKPNEAGIVEVDANGRVNFIDTSVSIAQLFECNYGGVFVLTTERELMYIDHQGLPHHIHSNVASFVADCYNGNIHVITDSTLLIKLSIKGEKLFEKEVSLGSIKRFKSGIVITQNDQIFKLDHRSKSFKRIDNDEFGNLGIIDSRYLYSKSAQEVKLINIEKRAKEVYKIKTTSLVEEFSTALQHLLITSDETLRQVYDLTDFLHTHEPNSIKKFQFRMDKNYPYHLIATTPNSQLGYVGLDENLHGEVFSLFDGAKLKSIKPSKPQFSAEKGIYIMIDAPESDKIISEVYNLAKESNNGLVFTNWLHRVIRHLSELGRYLVDYKHWFESEDLSMDVFNKLIVFYDSSQHKVIALNSYDGEVAWESAPLGGASDLLALKQLDAKEGQGEIVVVFPTEIYRLSSYNGEILEVTTNENDYVNVIPIDGDTNYALEDSQKFTLSSTNSHKTPLYFAKTVNNNEINGHVIPPGSSSSTQTWSFNFNGPIVSQARINNLDSQISAIGIPKSDKSVLYKYLNRNLIAVLTLEDELKLHLLDGISGELLYQQTHNKSEIVDPESVNLVIDDNWIVYTFFTKQPRLEQRINVVDLFTGRTKPTKGDAGAKARIGQIFSESFIYPERILDLSSTQSRYGITLKSIIACTESGNLVELPKFILNSRRPRHEMKPVEYQDDFRLTPYEPVVAKNNFQTINHKYQLWVSEKHEDVTSSGHGVSTHPSSSSSSSILIKPTDFESTVVVCFVNDQVRYCSLLQPSLSFDLLNPKFEKLKLVATIVILFVVYIVSKPYVANKRLKSQWLDVKK
ncbi:hypothetical protein KGF57_003030 [Candida theae]|uniref:ER membrane protein complex subunit 1 n=1 Tax=Candida theae TaxID=1198502 RepID=A0AAD5BE54_9ASCO|nr:uncharacterized protein KGF57_003030 [Candida theae]KAI5957763.1 hypothetical protein KGF57_003030 [Candida theae]